MDMVWGLPVSLLHELENARAYSIPVNPPCLILLLLFHRVCEDVLWRRPIGRLLHLGAQTHGRGLDLPRGKVRDEDQLVPSRYAIPEQPLKDASTLMTSFSTSRNVLDSWNMTSNQTKFPPIPYSISLRDGTLERVCGLTGLCKSVSV